MMTNQNAADSGSASSKLSVSYVEIKKLKSEVKKLIDEIKKQTPGIISRASASARWAATEYGVTMSGKTDAVLTQCDKLLSDSAAALRDLEVMAYGLDKVSEGYTALEQELSDSYDHLLQ